MSFSIGCLGPNRGRCMVYLKAHGDLASRLVMGIIGVIMWLMGVITYLLGLHNPQSRFFEHHAV